MELDISDITRKYWLPEHWAALSKAQSVNELYGIACSVIQQMPQGEIVQVCGPIATGGRGSVETNLAYFNESIKTLQANGLHVFDQMPFEKPMQQLKESIPGFRDTILDHFYLPILESGKISELYFLPGWETSFGAQWEHTQGKRLGIKITYM